MEALSLAHDDHEHDDLTDCQDCKPAPAGPGPSPAKPTTLPVAADIRPGWSNGVIELLDPVEEGWRLVKALGGEAVEQHVELEPVAEITPRISTPHGRRYADHYEQETTEHGW